MRQFLDVVTPESFRQAYAAGISERIVRGDLIRETAWTDGLAVGSKPYVERVARQPNRLQIEYAPLTDSGRSEGWWVREHPRIAYGAFRDPETGYRGQ